MRAGRVVLAALVMAGGFGPAAAQAPAGPPGAPILRIETGAHTGEVTRAVRLGKQDVVATAAYDGTIRLWSLPNLEPGRVIRLPVDKGRQGAVYALAASPDGTKLAAGGWTGGWGGSEAWCVHVIAVATGQFEKSRCDLPRRPTALAYSPDGKHIAVGTKKGGGLFVLEAASFATTAEDKAYGDDSNWVEFDAAGRLVSTSLDGFVRLYDPLFKPLASRKMPDERAPTCATFSPDGSRIAIGYGEIDQPQPPAVDVLAADTLASAYRPDVRGVDNGVLSRLAWSADGEMLYAAGTFRRGERTLVRRWSDAGRGRPRDLPSVPERSTFLLALGGGAVLATGITPHLALIGADGRLAVERKPPIADFRSLGDAFKVSADGQRVGFALEAFGRRPAHFSLGERAIREGAVEGADMAAARIEHPAIDLRDWQDGWAPTLDDKPLDLLPYDQTLSLAIDTDGAGFLLGTVWSIYRFDAKGKRVWRVQMPAPVHALVATPDGRRIVAALGDGSIRWLAAEGRREVAALLPAADAKAWIAWTPSGYYMTGAGGDGLLGWQVNRGPEQAADFFGAARFRDTYYRPDIVRQTLASLDEGGAIRGAGAAARDVADLIPPVIELLDPTDGATVSTPELTLRFALRSPPAAPATAIRVLTDGRVLGTYPLGLTPRGADGADSLRLTVPRRDVDLSLIALSARGASEVTRARLRWGGPSSVYEEKPRVHVLAVGIAAYADPALKLGLPAKDAGDFVAAIKRQEGRIFAQVEAEVLTDAEATRPRIEAALARLQKAAAFDDLVLVFFAGHGFTDRTGAYHFMTVNTPKAAPARDALPDSALRAGIAGIGANVVLFLDTCHSGAAFGSPLERPVDQQRVVNDLTAAENGVVVFAASTGDQVSYENQAWGNGAFTKALVEGLDGGARLGGRRDITIGMLNVYVEQRVRDLTADRQMPLMGKPVAMRDVTLAQAEN